MGDEPKILGAGGDGMHRDTLGAGIDHVDNAGRALGDVDVAARDHRSAESPRLGGEEGLSTGTDRRVDDVNRCIVHGGDESGCVADDRCLRGHRAGQASDRLTSEVLNRQAIDQRQRVPEADQPLGSLKGPGRGTVGANDHEFFVDHHGCAEPIGHDVGRSDQRRALQIGPDIEADDTHVVERGERDGLGPDVGVRDPAVDRSGPGDRLAGGIDARDNPCGSVDHDHRGLALADLEIRARPADFHAALDITRQRVELDDLAGGGSGDPQRTHGALDTGYDSVVDLERGEAGHGQHGRHQGTNYRLLHPPHRLERTFSPGRHRERRIPHPPATASA